MGTREDTARADFPQCGRWPLKRELRVGRVGKEFRIIRV